MKCGDCGRILYEGPGPFPKELSGEGDTARTPCRACGSTARSYSVHAEDHLNLSDDARVLVTLGPVTVVSGATLELKVLPRPVTLSGAVIGTSSATGSVSVGTPARYVEATVPTRPRDQLEYLLVMLAGMTAGAEISTTLVDSPASHALGLVVGVAWSVRTYNRFRPKRH